MGVTHFPNGINFGDAAGNAGAFQIGGTATTVTAAELDAIAGTGVSAAEFDYLDGALAGVVVANKAVVVDGDKAIDTLDIAASGLKIATVAVTATAAELNYIDTSVPGTAVASKALVLGTGKNVDTLDIDAGGFKIATVAVSSTAAELNKVDGILGNALAYDNAGFRILASGSVAITGSGTVATGLADVQHVVGSLAGVVTAGTAAATDAVTLIVDPVTVGGGSVIFRCLGPTGIDATTAGTVHWMALGTAA